MHSRWAHALKARFAAQNRAQGLYSQHETAAVKHPVKANIAGRVLLGPKAVHGGYARIVAQKDGSGCIESFNPVSRTWFAAPLSVTFAEVWGAPLVAPELWARIGDKP